MDSLKSKDCSNSLENKDSSMSKDCSNMNSSTSKDCSNTEDYYVKIIVGKEPDIKEFKTHSAILSFRSNYFKNALSSQRAKKEDGIIVLEQPNISPLAFEVLMK